MQKFTLGALTLLASAGMTVGATNIAHATTVDATGVTFQFGVDGQTVDDVNDLGYVGSAEGTSIRYTGVATIDGTVIDGVVTFVDGTNLTAYDDDTSNYVDGYLDRIDDTFPDDEEDPYIESALESTADGEAIAEMRVDFFETGTSTPVTINNLPMNIYDIDALQWVEVEGVAGYSVSTNTHLTVTNPSTGTYKFTSPDEGTDSDDGTAYTVGRAKVILNATSSVTYRLSIPVESNGSFDADFSAGVAWQDQNGGGEDTSNLPSLPTTGFAMWSIFALAVVAIAGGAAIEMKRRTSN